MLRTGYDGLLRLSLLLTLAAAALSLAPRASGGAAATEERWHVVEMWGQRAGWMRTRETVDNGRRTSETRMELQVGRGQIPLQIVMEGVFVETEDGMPLSMRSMQRMGQQPATTKYEFTESGVRITDVQGERESKREAPLPTGEWLTPGQARAYMEKRLDEGAKEFSVTTIDPMIGLVPVTATYTIDERTTAQAFGKTVPAVKWRVRQSYMPGVEGVEYVTEDGEPIRSEVNLGGITMSIIASEKEVALSPLNPPEIMASTLVKPSRGIDNPRRTRRATYVLSLPDGDLPEPPSAGAQRVQELDALRARVTVNTTSPAPAPAAEVFDARFTGASMMIDPSDPEIAQLARRSLSSVRADAPKALRAERLRRAVHDFINAKSLDVGLASASEVCRTREGDCSEHAVLLAALLRAEGIPSRVASGLIYVDEFLGHEGVFGYHMWTQALLEIDGEMRWIDLDATLEDDVQSDAAHIALAVSSLAEGEMINSMAALAPVLGRLRIEVESVE